QLGIVVPICTDITNRSHHRKRSRTRESWNEWRMRDLRVFELPEAMAPIMQAIDDGQSTPPSSANSIVNHRSRKLKYTALNRRVVFHR
ncbi:MAG: hypothetical protein WB504_12975, partial [Pseudolabrys sp.]